MLFLHLQYISQNYGYYLQCNSTSLQNVLLRKSFTAHTTAKCALSIMCALVFLQMTPLCECLITHITAKWTLSMDHQSTLWDVLQIRNIQHRWMPRCHPRTACDTNMYAEVTFATSVPIVGANTWTLVLQYTEGEGKTHEQRLSVEYFLTYCLPQIKENAHSVCLELQCSW